MNIEDIRIISFVHLPCEKTIVPEIGLRLTTQDIRLAIIMCSTTVIRLVKKAEITLVFGAISIATPVCS